MCSDFGEVLSVSKEALLERYAASLWIDSSAGARSRRVVLRALCKSFGHGVRVGLGVLVLHPHTFEIGDAVFIGNTERGAIPA